jgi:hypothetical protein
MEIEVGDLIQLDTWFGDVYAEVTAVFGDMFDYITYSKGGEQRWEVFTFSDKVRRIIKKADIGKNMPKIAVLHTQLEYHGDFG